MARFRLRHLDRDYDLPTGDFVVGRAPNCQLVLDDPRVSRRHALFRVVPARLVVNDLRSRNGVLVNGVALKGPQALANLDVVTIGSQELRVHTLSPSGEAGYAARDAMPAMSAPFNPVEDPTEVGGPVTLLSLLDKALRVGRVEEARRIMESLFTEITRDPTAPRLRGQFLLEQTAGASLQLATTTGSAAWIDWLFKLYRRAGRVMPPSTVDELYTLVGRTAHTLSPEMREYAEWLRGEAERLGPSERFTLQRLEALVRTLRANDRPSD
jgi:hypothetical protein